MRRIFSITLSVILAASFLNACSPKTAVNGSKKDEYPTKPVQMLIPTKPGGDVDMNARLLSKHMDKYFGQTLVPTNVDGGNGGIAMQQVAEGKADGYTFFYNNYAVFTASVVESISYSYQDFRPVAMTSKTDAQIIVVSKDSLYQTTEALVKALQEKPGTVRFAATYGAPSQFHAVAIEKAVGGKFKKIDVSSGADKIVALLSGDIDVLSTTTSLMNDYISSGQVTVLGSLCGERSQFAPDIPTFNEQGIDLGEGFETGFVLYAHKDTPDEIVDKMAEAVKKTMEDPAALQEFKNSAFAPEVITGKGLEEKLAAVNHYYFGMQEDIKQDQF